MDQARQGPTRCYYQERIAGPSLAAVFVAARGDAGPTATLAGVTRQWIGRPGCPFAYSGSLGPQPITPRARARIEALGRLLAAEFGLVGLFGVDLILHGGEPYPVEVNPRYTASVEVIELALRRSLLAEHARACDPGAGALLGVVPAAPRVPPGVVGKLIVYAPTACRFPGIAEGRPPADDPFAVPRTGDLPDPGTCSEAGAPVLTLFARGRSLAACRLQLQRRRARWLDRLR
jgi:predicted ATP-grasp superfamily ATP-dependent carboligase